MRACDDPRRSAMRAEEAVVRTVIRQAAALTKARERRRALDAARDEHDRRVEQATAEALVALEARSEAEQALASATAALGVTLRTLLAEDVPAERAAQLLELDTAEIRRLTRSAGRSAAAATQPVAGGAVPIAAAEVDGATREATEAPPMVRGPGGGLQSGVLTPGRPVGAGRGDVPAVGGDGVDHGAEVVEGAQVEHRLMRSHVLRVE